MLNFDNCRDFYYLARRNLDYIRLNLFEAVPAYIGLVRLDLVLVGMTYFPKELNLLPSMTENYYLVGLWLH